jgi:hypothetical protein
MLTKEQEDHRESNSNPSPMHGQSKQGLTSSHDGAPTPKQQARIGFDRQASHAEGRYVCEAEQKLLDEYAACFDEPTDAERLADEINAYLQQLAPHQRDRKAAELLGFAMVALRGKDKP